MMDEEIDEEKGVLNLKEKGLNQIIEIINNFEQLEEVLKVKNQFYIK
jgi:hypothetical protein